MIYKILNDKEKVIIKSKNFNHVFDKKTGFSAVWGETKNDDPDYSPVGNLIVDCEWSTVCSLGCRACYKGNGPNGKNMSLEMFKKIIAKLPVSCSQVAGGIGDIDSNPELFDILKYSRDAGVIPNITINGYRMTTEYYDKLAKYCGAVAVSCYNNDVCYNAVKELTDRIGINDNPLTSVNIHAMLSKETKNDVWKVIRDTQTDPRLKNLGAVVLLSMKPKSRAVGAYNHLNYNDFKDIVEYCLINNISVGFDSCGCCRAVQSFKDLNLGVKKTANLIQMSESCESGLMSAYISIAGDYFPCSFSEGVGDWKEGISVVNCTDFVKDVWYAPKVNKWRKDILSAKDCNGCRTCLIYPEVSELGV